jgi:hypothetical protein
VPAVETFGTCAHHCLVLLLVTFCFAGGFPFMFPSLPVSLYLGVCLQKITCLVSMDYHFNITTVLLAILLDIKASIAILLASNSSSMITAILQYHLPLKLSGVHQLNQ